MTKQPMTATDHAEYSVEACERHPVVEGFQACIDTIYRELHELFQSGGLEQRVFVELRSRLWTRREAVCEALLPEAQRQKTGNKII